MTFVDSYGNEFDLKDYLSTLDQGWEFVRMFKHPQDSFAVVVETKHPDHGTMQQGLILA